MLSNQKGITATCIVKFIFTLNVNIYQFCICPFTAKEGCRLSNFLTYIGTATIKQESIVSGFVLTHQQQDTENANSLGQSRLFLIKLNSNDKVSKKESQINVKLCFI